VLSVPGKAAVSEVDGVALEYALVARRYMGGDAAAYLADIDQPGSRMARSRCAPTWVGIVDIQTRLPEAWAA
jgi:hypothetical protein